MTLIDKVRKDRQDARASNATVAYGILTLLVGELETNASRNRSDITDDQVVQMCKKLIKSNNDTITLIDAQTEEGQAKVQKLLVENAMLNIYLPVEMTEAEITKVLTDAKCATIGESMAYMLNNFPGKYDRGLASKVAKTLL